MPELSFLIKTSRDFLQKLEDEYQDFKQNPLSSRHAINCAMTAWHLTDWTYRDRYPEPEEKKIDRERKRRVIDQFCSDCPELRYMKDISNGSKHCGLDQGAGTISGTAYTGYFSRAFSNAFEIERLVVYVNDDNKIDFEDALEQVVSFWRAYFSVQSD